MKKLILFLFISNFIFAQTAVLDTNSILIGEQINFSISNTIGKTEVWPTYEEFLVEGVEIIQEGKLDTTENLISQKFIITAWDSGSYYIPPISFSANSKTEGLLLNVQTIILEEGAELKAAPVSMPAGDDGKASPVAGKNDMGGKTVDMSNSSDSGDKKGLVGDAKDMNVTGPQEAGDLKAEPKGHGAEKKGKAS